MKTTAGTCSTSVRYLASRLGSGGSAEAVIAGCQGAVAREHGGEVAQDGFRFEVVHGGCSFGHVIGVAPCRASSAPCSSTPW